MKICKGQVWRAREGGGWRSGTEVEVDGFRKAGEDTWWYSRYDKVVWFVVVGDDKLELMHPDTFEDKFELVS